MPRRNRIRSCLDPKIFIYYPPKAFTGTYWKYCTFRGNRIVKYKKPKPKTPWNDQIIYKVSHTVTVLNDNWITNLQQPLGASDCFSRNVLEVFRKGCQAYEDQFKER